MDSDELKPCPFCGGRDVVYCDLTGCHWCRGCDAVGPYASDLQESAALWNRREAEEGDRG